MVTTIISQITCKNSIKVIVDCKFDDLHVYYGPSFSQYYVCLCFVVMIFLGRQAHVGIDIHVDS